MCISEFNNKVKVNYMAVTINHDAYNLSLVKPLIK